MIEEIAELCLAQEDGGLPTIFAAGGAPGESGVIVVTARFRGGMHINATPRRHHICFQISEQSRFACRIGDQALSHEPRSGSLAICPAGIDYERSKWKWRTAVTHGLRFVHPRRF